MAVPVRPGEMAYFIVDAPTYKRWQAQMEPNLWPLYFGARYGLHAVQNFALMALQMMRIDDLKKNLDLMIEAGLDVAREQAAAGPIGDEAALKADIKRLSGGLYDNWKSGIAQGMGGAFSTAMDDLIHTGQMVYAMKTLAYHIAISTRMRRRWNKEFTPMVPSGAMAWGLYRRGDFTREQWLTHMAWDGWSKTNAEILAKQMVNVPTPYEAFWLWCKGQISEPARNALYFAGGYDSEWWGPQTENWYYTPTIYDLTRIADYVELDQIWALDMMKRRGVRDTDRAKIWEMLEIRPLRDEIRAITSKWLWRFKFGRVMLDDLKAQLTLEKVKPRERDLLVKKAIMDYEDELIDEWIEILRWRFRTAVPLPGGSEESFRDELLKLGIREEKANLIVELEKAKGYYGYY